jgi:hypothetical protein
MAVGMLLLTSAVLWSALTCSFAARFYTSNRDTSTLFVLPKKLFLFALGGAADPAEQQVWYGRRHAAAHKRGALEHAHLLSCRAFLHCQGRKHVDTAFIIVVVNTYNYGTIHC